MISLLVISGISLTANAISWYNRKRIEAIQKDIDRLNQKYAEIKKEDIELRTEIVAGYIKDLIEFTKSEFDFREELFWELNEAYKKLSNSTKIGRSHSSRLLKQRSNLKKAISILNAEKYYLHHLKNRLTLYLEEPTSSLPTPEDVINLPQNYPADFSLVQIGEEVPNELHGYQIHYQDLQWREENQGWALLYNVDHEEQTAQASFSAAALFEAYEQESFPIEAVVQDFKRDGIELEYFGVPLLLKKSKKEYRNKPKVGVGDILEVYPDNWDLQDLGSAHSNQYDSFNDTNALEVTLIPRIENTNKRWSSLPLIVEEEQLTELVDAFNYLEDNDLNEEPFNLFFSEEDSNLNFKIDRVTIKCKVTSVLANGQSLNKLVYNELVFDQPEPSLYVTLNTELTVSVNSTDNEPEDLNHKDISDFLLALDKELEDKREFLNIRRNSLRLKKFSSIYEDKIEYKRLNSVCSFFQSKVSISKATVEGIIPENIAEWFREELNGDYTYRIEAVSEHRKFKIRKAELLDEHINLYKLYLDVPPSVDNRVITESSINRIIYNIDGIPAQVLSNTLKKTAAGRFKSSQIYDTLMDLNGKERENKNLGREQVDALINDSENELVIVWGPPGTGKTTTLVDWLLKLFDSSKESEWPSVLITGPTHVSIDNILERLLVKNGALNETMVRYGAEEKIDSDLLPIWHKHLKDQLLQSENGNLGDKELQEKWNKLLETRSGERDAIKWTVSKRKIHAATCVGMANRAYNLTNRDFDIVIIDEAGKAFPAELLLPASLASKKLVIVGDHKQLPPTVMPEDLKKDIHRLSLDEVEAILKDNMFRRLFEQLPAEHKAMLNLQYRMHKDIGDVISSMFYEGKLKSFKKNNESKVLKNRLAFIDFSKSRRYRQKRFGDSLQNYEEINALKQFLLQLNKKKAFNENILIICPYQGQRIQAQRLIKRLKVDLNITVSTVDAVQGGEASLVLLLMTRSWNSTDFLLDENRINVALSRAEESVIVFGHRKCLTEKSHSPFKKLLSKKIHKGNLSLIEVADRANYKNIFASLLFK